MKILQVIHRLEIGGAERVALDLTNMLHENGYAVEIVCVLDIGELESELASAIPRHHLKRGWKWNFLKMKKLAHLCRQFSLIHVHLRHNLRYLFLAKVLFRFRSPIVFHDHFGQIDVDRNLSWLDRILFRQVDFYIGVTNKLTRWVNNEVGLPKESVQDLPNIVRITSQPVSIDNQQGILMVGNFRPIKNYEFALDLFERICASSSRAKLVIYGNPVDKEYYNMIGRRIREKRLNEKVQIVSNNHNLDKIIPNYRMALHTSRSETGPLVAMEYLAHGVPFIAFRTGGVVEKIRPDYSKYVLDNFDLDSWWVAYTRLMDDENSGPEALKSIYRKHFSEKEYLQKCLEIYQKVLG